MLFELFENGCNDIANSSVIHLIVLVIEIFIETENMWLHT